MLRYIYFLLIGFCYLSCNNPTVPSFSTLKNNTDSLLLEKKITDSLLLMGLDFSAAPKGIALTQHKSTIAAFGNNYDADGKLPCAEVFSFSDIPIQLVMNNFTIDDGNWITSCCKERKKVHSHIIVDKKRFYFDDFFKEVQGKRGYSFNLEEFNIAWRPSSSISSFQLGTIQYYLLELQEVCMTCSYPDPLYFLITANPIRVYFLEWYTYQYIWDDFDKDGNLDFLPLLYDMENYSGVMHGDTDTSHVYSLINNKFEKQPYFLSWCRQPTDNFKEFIGVSKKHSNWYPNMPLQPMPKE